MKRVELDQIVQNLLIELKNSVLLLQKQNINGILKRLQYIFGKQLADSLKLADTHIIKYQVQDESYCIYKIDELLVQDNGLTGFCKCQDFVLQLGQKSGLHCKHIIGVRIANILQRCEIQMISENQNRDLQRQLAPK